MCLKVWKRNKQPQKLHIVSSNFILKNICKGFISKASLERSGATVQLLLNPWPHSRNSASWCTFLQFSTGKISCFWFKVLHIWESAECQSKCQNVRTRNPEHVTKILSCVKCSVGAKFVSLLLFSSPCFHSVTEHGNSLSNIQNVCKKPR